MSTLAPKKIRSTVASALANVLRLYLRQSIGEDRNTHGIDAQRGICERYAREHGLTWDTRIEYVDVGYSRDDEERPEYLRLLADAREGDVVLIWERSRLGVDIDFAYAVRGLVQRRKAQVVVASGSPIDASHNGLVMEHMQGNQNGGELRNIRSRTQAKLRERVLKGYVAGPLPFGYEIFAEDPANRDDSLKRGRVHPVDSGIVLRMVEMYANGAGWQRIARTLNREGVLPPGGAPRPRKNKRTGEIRLTRGEWDRSHVWDVLVNNAPVYRDGVYTYGVRGGKGEKLPPIAVEHPEWRIGAPELWARFDAARAARTRDVGAQLNACRHALSGVGRCAACKGALSVQRDGRPGKKVTDYQCSGHRRGFKCPVKYRVRADYLENKIRDALGEWFDAARGAIRDAARDVEARVAAQAAPDVAGIERELAAARAEQSRLVRLAMATDGAVDAVTDALNAGQATVKRLEAAHTRATAPRTDARLIGRQIEKRAVEHLDELRVALHGPDARGALTALFPRGLRVELTEREVRVEAEGEILPTVDSSSA